jgi:hypothetical protein
VHLRIDRAERAPARLCLGQADAIAGVQDLPLQVGEVDGVAVNQGQRADAG